jgi:hypothetical protein
MATRKFHNASNRLEQYELRRETGELVSTHHTLAEAESAARELPGKFKVYLFTGRLISTLAD